MKKYEIIYADPAWSFTDKANAGDRGSCHKYDVMSINDICALPVREYAADDCALFMWAVWSQLPAAMRVMKHWGFDYVNCAFVWVKKTKNDRNFWGMGHTTRQGTEPVLYGRRGKPKRVSAGVHQVIEARVREHSRKPDVVRDRIVELMGDKPRLEMFCRGDGAVGWDTWGNEAESGIEIVSSMDTKLQKLRRLGQRY